jgi:dihydropyrimidinase
MYPKKGTIALGADADIAIWNPEKRVVIGTAMLHDNVGYTPYEGRQVQGWPEIIISRGRIVIDQNGLQVAPGSGQFIKRGTPEPVLRQRLNGNPNSVMRKYFS